jgi:hypothetical protein
VRNTGNENFRSRASWGRNVGFLNDGTELSFELSWKVQIGSSRSILNGSQDFVGHLAMQVVGDLCFTSYAARCDCSLDFHCAVLFAERTFQFFLAKS